MEQSLKSPFERRPARPFAAWARLDDAEGGAAWAHVVEAAAAEGLEPERLEAARVKRMAEGKAALTPEELAAYRFLKNTVGAWSVERAGGPEAVAAKARADFQARTLAMVALTDETFEALVLEPKAPMLVQFYAAWCGPCHRAAPVLNAVAEEGYSIGKLDCEEAPATARRFAIRSYPTFVLFKRGGLYDVYRGPRTPDDMRRWLDAAIA